MEKLVKENRFTYKSCGCSELLEPFCSTQQLWPISSKLPSSCEVYRDENGEAVMARTRSWKGLLNRSIRRKPHPLPFPTQAWNTSWQRLLWAGNGYTCAHYPDTKRNSIFVVLSSQNGHARATIRRSSITQFVYMCDCLNRTSQENDKCPAYSGFRFIGRSFSRWAGVRRPKIVLFLTDSGLNSVRIKQCRLQYRKRIAACFVPSSPHEHVLNRLVVLQDNQA